MARNIHIIGHGLIELCQSNLVQSEPFMASSYASVLLFRYEILSLRQELWLLATDDNIKEDPEDKWPTLSTNLHHISGLLRQTSEEQLSEQPPTWTSRTEQLRITRLQLQSTHKGIKIQFLKSFPLDGKDIPKRLDSAVVLQAFQTNPFHINPQDIPVNAITMDSLAQALSGFEGSYTDSITAAAGKWIENAMRDVSSFGATKAVEEDLVTRIWDAMGTLRTIQLGWQEEQASDEEKFRASVDHLDQGLCDALYRHKSSNTSLVLIGGEGSGKSTFINNLIGQRVLPTGVGPTTMYPTRLQHCPGKRTPELSLDVNYLMKSAKRISNLGWTKKWKDYKENKKPMDLPPEIDFRRARSLYEDLYPRSLESLSAIEADDFQLPAVVTGTEEVVKALTYVNDIVRFCRIFSIPFDNFNTNTWAVIKVEFNTLRSENIESGAYEIFDLPGSFPGYLGHYGDELLREVMRQADVIIAVVSASRLYMDPSWRTIPELIFKGPNLLPSAVILTQSDVAPTGEDAVQYRKRQVSEAFWPDDGGGPILECSVRLGASAHALLDILESSVSKPSFEELWNGDAHGATVAMLHNVESFAKRKYDRLTREDLLSDTQEFCERNGLNRAVQFITTDVLSDGRRRALLDEVTSLTVYLRRLLVVMEYQMVHLGVVPRDRADAVHFHYRLQRLGDQLRLGWQEYGVQVNLVSEKAIHTLLSGLEGTLAEVLSKVMSNCTEIWHATALDADNQFVEFEKMNDLHDFCIATQKSLIESLCAIEIQFQADTNSELDKLREEQFPTIERRVRDINQDAKNSLAAVGSVILPQRDPTNDQILQVHEKAGDGHVTQTIVTAQRPDLKDMENRLLQLIGTPKRPKDSDAVRNLSPLARALLAAAAFIPYLLKRSFSSRKSEVPRFRLDIKGLQATLKELVSQPWADDLSQQVQSQLRQELASGHDIIEEALKFARESNAHSLQQPVQTPVTTLPGLMLSNLVANHANLTTAVVALEFIENSLKMQGHI